MKIIAVVPGMDLGGVTTSVINFCNELIKRGNEVHFLNMGPENEATEAKLDKNIKKLRLSGRSVNWNLGMGSLKKAKAVEKLKLFPLAILKKITNHTDAWRKIIFHNYCLKDTYDVAIAFRQCAPCYYFVLNCVNAKKKIGFVHGELKYMGDISSWKKFMTCFDKVAYVSKAVQREFESVYPELKRNSCAIYNMFDAEKIKKLSEDSNPCHFDKSKKNIVTVARIDNAFKRIHWIPEICDGLRKKTNIPFHWYIVGDGPDYNEVKQLIQKYNVEDLVTLVGAVDNPYAIMKDADFSVLLSKSEAYPMTVIESFILGAPIVVSRFGAVEEMMTDGRHGLISESSIEGLSEKILCFLNNPEVYNTCKDFLAGTEYTNDQEYKQFMDAIGG